MNCRWWQWMANEDGTRKKKKTRKVFEVIFKEKESQKWGYEMLKAQKGWLA